MRGCAPVASPAVAYCPLLSCALACAVPCSLGRPCCPLLPCCPGLVYPGLRCAALPGCCAVWRLRGWCAGSACSPACSPANPRPWLQLIRALTAALGSRLWDNAVLALTRSSEGAQPPGVDFHDHVAKRAQQLRRLIRKASPGLLPSACRSSRAAAKPSQAEAAKPRRRPLAWLLLRQAWRTGPSPSAVLRSGAAPTAVRCPPTLYCRPAAPSTPSFL